MKKMPNLVQISLQSDLYMILFVSIFFTIYESANIRLLNRSKDKKTMLSLQNRKNLYELAEYKIKKTPTIIPAKGINFLRLFFSLKTKPPITTAINN
jgi:hypothetical protein